MVARAAQVSRVAVSRAFNPNASLKPEKRALILEIARELNYTPDRDARALVTRRTHLVGVIVPEIWSPWESQEIDALTTALQAEGFATLLFKTRTEPLLESSMLAYMRGFNPDSVIAFVGNIRPDTLEELFPRAVPIYVEYPGSGRFSEFDDGHPTIDRLNVQIREGIEQAVALMHGFGARRFAYLTGSPSLASMAREACFRAVLEQRGLGAPLIVPGDYTYDTAHAATIELFRSGTTVDAILAANDVGAFGAIDALRHELGRSVPGDVMVVGYDNITQAHWQSYNLTTIGVDIDERVRALVKLILRRLRAPQSGPLSEDITARLVVRGTVGTSSET